MLRLPKELKTLNITTHHMFYTVCPFLTCAIGYLVYQKLHRNKQRAKHTPPTSIASPHSEETPGNVQDETNQDDSVCTEEVTKQAHEGVDTCHIRERVARSFVHNVFEKSIQLVATQLFRKSKLKDIVSMASDATTIVFSRDTWFQELRMCVLNQQRLSCASVKCPLTIRLSDAYDNRCLLLNAFAEYDVRLSYQLPPQAKDELHMSDSRITQQMFMKKLVEKHLQSQYYTSGEHIVTCKLTSEFCETKDMVQLLGVPLASSVSSYFISRLLVPNQWHFEKLSDLKQEIYAECTKYYNQEKHLLMTPDRALTMYDYEAEPDDEDEAHYDTSENAHNAHFFTHQPLMVVLCNCFSLEATTDHTNRDWVDDIKHIAVEHTGVFGHEQNACYIVVHRDKSMIVNQALHQWANIKNVHLQTYIVQVQNQAIAKTPRLTHVTMIEVV